MDYYVALLHGKPGKYGISFPDFPGCISAGASVGMALYRGSEALLFHIEGMVEDGESIPAPSTVEAIQANPEFADDVSGAIVTLVPVVTPANKPMRINVSLDSDLIVAIDKAAESAGSTRSGFLADAARRALSVPRYDPAAASFIDENSHYAASTHKQPGRDPRVREVKVVKNDGRISGRATRRRKSAQE